MSQFSKRLIEYAKKKACTIALPEGDDPRVIEAAYQLAKQKIAKPLLIADKQAFESIRISLGFPEPAFTVIDSAKMQAQIASEVFQIRQHKGLSEQQAQALALDPLVQAAVMLRTGQVDGVVAGAVRTTAETVRTAIQLVGMADDMPWLSSFFVMLHRQAEQERPLIYADCGVIVEPTEDQLVAIANASIGSWRQLTGRDPRVAFLAFSTHGSAEHESLSRIRAATQRVKSQHPDLHIDGELQADAALVPEIAQRKAPLSSVAGKADILIFPNLHAGNIAYKLTERLANATALGPILQGLCKPMNDLSRGCSSEDIVLVSAITANQARSY